ncbi:Leucine-rich repeat [Dillenia turbinata]|uniref:Leucine-rich repeat n=1 Tax=Dillenia turbinata TaxID=194707 RepID=A0AAN8VZJ2_9MAGN
MHERRLLLRKKLLVLVMVFSLFLPFSSSIADEGKALMGMKASFSNIANVLLDWDDAHSDDFCSWRGVFCDNLTLSVVSLNLSNLNLGGEISPSIGDLMFLQSVNLQGNKLSSQIPDEIGHCLSRASICYECLWLNSGFAVQCRDLSNNLLHGDIPFSISKLKQLELLNLKNNQLTGPIPSTLTQIPNLKTLDLARNKLTRDIPRLIYWNEVLQYFDVRGNNLTGTIPDSIGNCTSFEILDISYNQITGEIPYNIGFLQVAIAFSHMICHMLRILTGKIPEVIGLMQALAVLDLSENELVGPIPAILGNLSYTGKLYLHGNKHTGPIPPELGNMSKLSYLQLNDNQLVGSIPAELGKLEQLFELLVTFQSTVCVVYSLFLVLSMLKPFSGTLPTTIWRGLFHPISVYAPLSISCRIPLELGRIINPDTLDLSSNDFTGSIPASIGDLEHLLCTKMKNLSRNHLTGPVPAEFGNLRSVQMIDLSLNKLSGGLPEEIGLLQNIVALILNNNILGGEIPDQLTNCLSLATLNLSYNNFSGTIPPTRNFTRFSQDSFIGNPLLCANCVGSACGPCIPKSRVLLEWVVCCGYIFQSCSFLCGTRLHCAVIHGCGCPLPIKLLKTFFEGIHQSVLKNS